MKAHKIKRIPLRHFRKMWKSLVANDKILSFENLKLQMYLGSYNELLNFHFLGKHIKILCR